VSIISAAFPADTKSNRDPNPNTNSLFIYDIEWLAIFILSLTVYATN